VASKRSGTANENADEEAHGGAKDESKNRRTGPISSWFHQKYRYLLQRLKCLMKPWKSRFYAAVVLSCSLCSQYVDDPVMVKRFVSTAAVVSTVIFVISEIQSAINAGKLKTIASDVSDVKNSMDENGVSRFVGVQSSLATMEQQMEESKKSTEKVQEDVEIIKTQLEESKKSTEKVQEDVEMIKTQLEESKKSTEKVQEDVEMIKTQLEESKKSTEKVQEDVEIIKTQLEDSSEKVEELAKESKKSTKKVQELTTKLDLVVASLGRIEGRLTGAPAAPVPTGSH
jgi:methyl-accepting chemotaxis protein